ncbi:PREDICTED: uncharacterized protein LOC105620578 [Atta cephalotes]|uniref:Uncharacterized protein n=1 Tax=Atta cephalotes TaxID=12957 RepID=A0A158NIV1_ATTCE|nr:PREDICTED: uncharacterized protein LOC105620578 [Atta cephalotes]
MESQMILPQEQMDFNRSCTDSLVILTNNIHTSFLANEVVAAAFLDITGAFDNVLSEAVLSETQKIGIPARLRKFIQKTLSLIEVYTLLRSHLSEVYSVHKRTPQDSMLAQLTIFLVFARWTSTTPWN